MAKNEKPNYLLISCGLILITIGVVLAVIKLSSSYLNKQSSKKNPSVSACSSTQHLIHQVAIQDDKAVPEHTNAALCDILIITNQDEKVKLMAFGEHDSHKAYDGITEKLLQKGQDLTVTLNQTGTYIFHDHIGDKAQGSFTVK